MLAAETLVVCSERVLRHFLPLSLSAQDSRSNKLQASDKRHSSQVSSWQGCGPPRKLLPALHTAPRLSAQSPQLPELLSFVSSSSLVCKKNCWLEWRKFALRWN